METFFGVSILISGILFIAAFMWLCMETYPNFKRKHTRGINATDEARNLKINVIVMLLSPLGIFIVPMLLLALVGYGMFCLVKGIFVAFNYEYQEDR